MDVPQGKNTENDRQNNDSLYRIILQTTVDGFWLLDRQGNILEVNDAYCRMSGYTQDELLTMSVPDLEAEEDPGDTAAHMQKIAEQGWDRFETRHKRRDGSTYHVEVSVQYQDYEYGRLVCFLRDITELKRNEQALKEEKQLLEDMFRHHSAIMFIIDQDQEGRIVDANNAALRFYGYDYEEITNISIRSASSNEQGL